jgi:hypothetical protein
MKFASTTHIVIMAVVACAALFGLDFVKNPQLWHATSVAAATPVKEQRLTLYMNHLCCTECLDDVRKALTDMPALDMTKAVTPANLLTREQADKMNASMPDYGNKIEIPITDLDKLDFVALDRALRDHGMVAGRMEISGVEHFHLEAKLDHICCGMCDRATMEKVQFMKSKAAGGQFTWLDSVNVDHEKKTITAYARYLQPGKTMDVEEFLGGLNEIGFAPRSVQVQAGEETQHVHQSAADEAAPMHMHTTGNQ